MDRREFLKISGLGALALVLSSCGFSKQTASSAQLTGGGRSATGKEKVAGTGGDKYIPPEQRQGNESVVYFTRTCRRLAC
nr:twin-arginine translocation signal domain-containing protein [Acidaminococcus fermentans]